MTNYIPPLSVVFVWHPADTSEIKPIVEHCYSFLSRNVDKPFSRSMNLPVFFRTTTKKGVPVNIEKQSNKTVIFVFISEAVVADRVWVGYIRRLPEEEGIVVIPVAMDRTAYNLNKEFEYKNFIRAYDFAKEFLNEFMFISIAHEIYRYVLNESFNELSVGKDNALKLFISHAKDGKKGIKLAKALKQFIDNTTMRNFFDATDIGIGYKFDQEIIEHISDSTVIAIHSDAYSSRYWCQREILSAKEQNRPIIAVDTLEEFEDRRFPFASNIPGIHVHFDNDPEVKDLLRILCAALLETVRYFYSRLLLQQYKEVGWIQSDVQICSRPPEVSDIEKILSCNGESIVCNHKALVYPEPPLYEEELSFLRKLDIKLNTPLTFDLCGPLDRINIGLSISGPSEEEMVAIGQSSVHLTQLSQDISRHFLNRCATLLYGGDLREGGFTEFIFSEAQALQARTQSENIHIENYIAWPIYNSDSVDVTKWKAKYRTVASMIEVPPVDDTLELIPSKDIFLSPTNTQNRYVWSRCLTEMRQILVDKCNVRICAGGTHSGYKGRMPGVLEEIYFTLDKEKPIFLLGGFGGVTSSVCRLKQGGDVPQELTLEWQIENNPGYKELLEFSSSQQDQYSVDYGLLVNKLKNANLNNGLSRDDNNKLFNTPFIDEALYLIFKGLKSLF